MDWSLENLKQILLGLPKNNNIDLSQYDFAHPIFLLWILSLYAEMKITFSWLDKTYLNTYLSRSNFYKYIWYQNIEVKKSKNETMIEIDDIQQDMTTQQVQEIDIMTTKILKNLWLDQISIDNLFNTFYWLIFELLYNVTTHSQADFSKKWCLYMMQVSHNLWYLNFTVVDNWIWMKESFRWSEYYDESRWYDYYLDLAFQKWITRNTSIGAGNWLYWTVEIIKESDSQLLMYSWDAIFKQNGKDKIIEKGLPFWKWTLIDIKLNIEKIDSDLVTKLVSNWVIKSPIQANELEHLEDLFV